MRPSVKHKLFLFMTGLIAFYVLLSWILIDQFLGKYYLYNKRRELINIYREIDRKYTGDPAGVSLELEKLENMRGLRVVIFDKDFRVKYSSLSGREDWRLKQPALNRMLKRGLLQELSGPGAGTAEGRRQPFETIIKSNAKEIRLGKVIIRTLTNSRMNADFINLIAGLRNGDILSLNTPVAAIDESVVTANRFFIFTGLFVIITGSIVIFVLAGRFTKPLLELSEIARKMSLLDFSHKYPVTTRDEIGELGASINSLSEQLERSITGLREANEKLTEDIERERKIDEMRKEFISNVSHELKTPIALIQGYAEGLKANVNEDEMNRNFYCEVIADEANKMNRLVKQLLDLSHLESGFSHPDRTDFELSFLVEQVLKKSALMLNENNITLTLDKEKDMIVNADYDRMEQVLTNYINNAVNHVDERKIIKVSIKQADGKARVSVYNSGKHIPEQYLEKIWASFTKVDQARTREYGGTGLGLSIVRAIQEAHHNRYGVENVEGGVEFWFEVDMAK